MTHSFPDNSLQLFKLDDEETRKIAEQMNFSDLQETHIVQDKAGEKTIFILLHGPHGGGQIPRQIVKFSRNEYALTNSDYLRLFPSGYFRDLEHNKPLTDKQRDEDEGVMHMDVTDYILRQVRMPSQVQDFRAKGTFNSNSLDWMFCCTALKSSSPESGQLLKDDFSDYDTETEINNVSDFAVQPAINTASSLISKPLSYNELLTKVLKQKRIRNLDKALSHFSIHVYQGLVSYSDEMPQFRADEFTQPDNKLRYPDNLFAKSKQFEQQAEYRFLLSANFLILDDGGEPAEASYIDIPTTGLDRYLGETRQIKR